MTTHAAIQKPRPPSSTRPSTDTKAPEHLRDDMRPRPRIVARMLPIPMLSPAGVADLLQVSIKTVRRWIDAGELHVHRLGRQLRISTEDLNAFVKQRRE